MAKGRNWTREELLVAFNLYCRTPFGRMHARNPEIIATAEALQRSPGSVAMKLCNFASLDPSEPATGLTGASRLDREVWDEFHANWEQLAYESEMARIHLRDEREPADIVETNVRLDFPTGQTERTQTIRVRMVQSFFRKAVLHSYEGRCAVCSLNVRALLNASHIIPWSVDEHRRVDPRNGLALCALHDRAFDKGFISIDEEQRILVSPRLRIPQPSALHRLALLEIDGQPIARPSRFLPDPAALEYHRTAVFIRTA